MRVLSCYLFAAVSLFSIACKKSDSSPNQIQRSIYYKVVATIPSPADQARGIFEDSISSSDIATNSTSDPKFLSNLPGLGANLSSYGFSMGYENDNLSFPYFTFSASAFPSVPENIELNKTYESTNASTVLSPIFLGRRGGTDAWNYFVNNEWPDDADQMTNTSFTKVKFTGRQEFQMQGLSTPIQVVDGEASGYVIYHYSTADPSKYVHRLDFTVRFTGLVLNL